jgi:hypothetical protein
LSNQSSVELSAPSQQAAAAAAAYALAQEDKKAANKLNAELCKNFSIGLQHEMGGVFTSPNYPNPYPANLICTKLIEGKSVQTPLCARSLLGPLPPRSIAFHNQHARHAIR